jgi:hypothetical protein
MCIGATLAFVYNDATSKSKCVSFYSRIIDEKIMERMFKREFIDMLRNCQILKKGSAPWGYVATHHWSRELVGSSCSCIFWGLVQFWGKAENTLFCLNPEEHKI